MSFRGNYRCVISGIVSLGLFSSCSISKQAQINPSNMSRMDSVAYAFGVINAESFERILSKVPGDSLNRQELIKGFSDRLQVASSLLINLESARNVFESYLKDLQEQENLKRVAQNDSIFEANKLKPEFKTTSSGLQYNVIREGNGTQVSSSQDTVVVHYVGKLIDGRVFDNSYDRQVPATFPLNQVIEGWTEGIALMKVGSKYQFYIPDKLAYGANGAGGVIPPHSTLIFDVELLNIHPKQEAKDEPITNKDNKKRK